MQKNWDTRLYSDTVFADHFVLRSQESDDESHQRPIRSPANPGEDVPLTCGGEKREQRRLPRLVVQSSQGGPIQVSRGVMSGRTHQHKSADIEMIWFQQRVWSPPSRVGGCDALWETANKESEDIGLIGKRVTQMGTSVNYKRMQQIASIVIHLSSEK